MNAELIYRWNEVVYPGDTVYHLGDLGFGDLSAIRSMLNGEIHLIQGNHDSSRTWNSFRLMSRQHNLMLNYGGLDIFLTHYPIWQSDHAHRRPQAAFDLCLYGHVHNTGPIWFQHGNEWYMNCCVEMHNYQPVLLDNIVEQLYQNKQQIVDCAA